MSDRDRPPAAKPRVAFVSGHMDLAPDCFHAHYAASLNAAIASNDSFILSSSRGADALALDYLLAANVPRDRITVYLNTHLAPKEPPRGSKDRKAAQAAVKANRRDPAPDLIQKYEDLGVAVRLVSGDHAKRDTVMTRQSDYDVLWVRPDEETKALYGKKFRAGRVSGTEKNRLRREVIVAGRAASERKGIANSEDAGGQGGSDRDRGER